MIDRNDEIRRVLITGISGSGGRCLLEYLRAEHSGVEVHGAVRRKASRRGLDAVLHEVDLLDFGSIVQCLRRSRPDAIFHLAANSDKGFEIPTAMLLNNTVGSANLLEAVRLERGECLEPIGKRSPYEMGVRNFDPVVVVVSSSEVYGDVRPEDVPITEECPMRPVSPYAISKMAEDHLGRLYNRAYGLKTVVTRAFSYINFRHPSIFTTAFARQIAEIEQGKREFLEHGNLDSVRTFVDTRDIMHAYWLAATRCRFGEAYNIGGTATMSVREVLGKLITLSGQHPEAARWTPVWTERDPTLLRPVDVTQQIPCSDKFIAETGWERRFNIDESIRGLLDHWRKEVVRG